MEKEINWLRRIVLFINIRMRRAERERMIDDAARSNQFYPELGNFLSLFRSPSWKQRARRATRGWCVVATARFRCLWRWTQHVYGFAMVVERKIDRLILGNWGIWCMFRDFNLCGYLVGFAPRTQTMKSLPAAIIKYSRWTNLFQFTFSPANLIRDINF